MTWRVLLILGAAGILIGGPMHPRDETMEAMLANPAWFPSHALVTVAYGLLIASLVLLVRRGDLPARTAWWTRVAIAATSAQMLEMVLHTAAMVDHGNLVAGRATPVLTTHLAMTAVVYPIWGVAFACWIAIAARERAIGSPWIAPIGMIGTLGHGFAIVFLMAGAPWGRALFPLILGLAVWMAITALLPAGARLPAPRSASAASV